MTDHWTTVTQATILLTAIFGAVKAWQAKKGADQNKAAILEVHLSMNSRMDELIRASRAQGRQDERDDQKDRGAKAVGGTEETGAEP
jgi:hypothetical protein